jgi:circadian clock protein KaiC
MRKVSAKPSGHKRPSPSPLLPKCPTGIQGLDEITGGGLPRGRPTLVCGGAGCGKTLLAAEFLVRGAAQYGEPGVFMAFEETEKELKANVASLGFGLDDLVRRGKMVVDYVHIERNDFQESGEYDLEGIFVRLGHAIDSIGAKRVVLDTLEVLFASLPNEATLRSELRRLFRWLKDKGVTAVITAERGREQLTRHGLEEYVSDCVIVLDHRVNDQIATRHLRVVKYRGAMHGTNEFPFLIGDDGIGVLPITSLSLNHKASIERIATGIPRLDAMLGGKGFFRGSSILITGTPGTGKTIISCNFAQAAAAVASACSTFPSRNRQTRSCATCIPSDCVSSPLCKKAFCVFTLHAPHSTAWKCISPPCSKRSPRSNRTSSSLNPSPV